MTRDHRRLIATACLALSLSACAAAPRGRPIPTSPVEDTTSSARKQFEGNWTLVSFKVTNPAGRQATIDAAGTLSSDEFGVMRVEYRLSDEGVRQMTGLGFPTPNAVISTNGRVVIDTQQKRVTYVTEGSEATGFDPDLAYRRANPVGLERTRYYSFAADGTLDLHTRYDDGKEASSAVWRKSP